MIPEHNPWADEWEPVVGDVAPAVAAGPEAAVTVPADEPDAAEPGAGPGAEPATPTPEPTLEPGQVDPAEHDDTGLDLATMIAHSARGRRPAPAPRPRRTRAEGATFSSARKDPRDPQPLADAVGRLADEQGWHQTVSVHLLLSRWAAVVGPTVAQHTHPEAFRDGTLVVRASSTAWATQLRLMAPQLLARLNDEVGQGSVALIQVLGPDAPSWKHGTWSVSDGRGPRDTYG